VKGNDLRVEAIFLWKLLLLSWLYLGFFRNVIPQISTPLYFVHDLLILVIFLKFRAKEINSRHILAWLIITSLMIYQFFSFLFGNVTLIGFVQGINLYCLGMLLFVSTENNDLKLRALNFTSIIEISMIPNFILAVLQVPLKIPYFQKSTLSDLGHLNSADGYIRAYGTFTSTAGFTLYLSVVFAYCLTNLNRASRFKGIFLQLVGLSMLVMSQSRTALVIVIFQYIVYAVISQRPANGFSLQPFSPVQKKVKLGKLLALIMAILIFILPDTLRAFSNRISQASRAENSISRLLDQQFSWLNYVDYGLVGDGLASHTIGVVGYLNSSQLWIEKDLERILAESGLVLGLFIILFRFCWAILLLKSFNILLHNRQFEMAILIPALLITLLQGPLYGQNDTNIFGWIFLTIFASTRQKINFSISNK
jgi:hypothetical protein